jgi:hypothetical protein
MFALDENIFSERYRQARAAVETHERTPNLTSSDLQSHNIIIRFVALKRLRRAVETYSSCEQLGQNLRLAVERASCASTTQELELAWCILVQCAAFPDALSLVGVGAAEAAALTFMSPLASEFAFVLLSEFLSLMVPKAPLNFAMLLQPPTLPRVVTNTPVCAAHLSLCVPYGLCMLASHNLVSSVLVLLVPTEPTLASEFVDAITTDLKFAPHVRDAVQWMCANSHTSSPLLATLAWWSADVARMISEVQVSGMFAAARDSCDAESLLAVMDLAHALRENAGYECIQAAVLCATWAAGSTFHVVPNSELIEFAARCAGGSGDCAAQVFAAIPDFKAFCNRESNGFHLAASVFSHAQVVLAHAENVKSMVDDLDVEDDDPEKLSFISAVASAPAGRMLLLERPRLLRILASRCCGYDEVCLSMVRDIMLQCFTAQEAIKVLQAIKATMPLGAGDLGDVLC